MSLRGLRRRVDLLPALVALAALATLARLLALGERIAHWDEGRVAYGILRYSATGIWEYRPIVHGPFLPQVNKYVFALLGANDFTMRLVVAVVGGLLPLAAWLYRERLRDAEVAALAVFLAVDPVLVYYSRFMRNDVLVATFAFVGVGLLVRFLDTRRTRYLYAAAPAWALAFTAKENALLYVLAVLGALVLLLDHRLFLAREGSPAWTTVAIGYLRRTLAGLWRYRLPLAVAAVEFLVVIVYFYAPRAGPTAGIGLWKAFGQPTMLPDVVWAATYGAGEKLVDSWITGGHQDHPYLPFLAANLTVIATASGGLALLSVLGFIVDRYRGERPRDLVSLAFYWGAVSVLGYPIVVDIQAAWTATHAVVPLAIPAAVGAALIYRWGREALAAGEGVDAGLAALVLLLVGGQLVGTAVTTSYLNPQREGNVMIQYAQPEGEMRPALRAVDRAAGANAGLDVLYYGGHFYLQNESADYTLPVADGEWYHRLPMPWYLERFNATRNSTLRANRVREAAGTGGPPVVITCLDADECPTEEQVGDFEEALAGYRRFQYEGRQFGLKFVFFVRERYA